MKFFRIINIIITILNILYLILINTLYVQLPVPNKEYLRDLNFNGTFKKYFINISLVSLSINILFIVLYFIKYYRNLKKKEIIFNILLIVMEFLIIILSLLYAEYI